MKARDILHYTWQALRSYRLRTVLMLLAMAIGVAAVILLTALGEGARRYVSNEFASLGTNLLIVVPGRMETAGASPSMFLGETPRDLTLHDALALTRIAGVRRLTAIVVGSASVSHAQREREVTVVGATPEMLPIRHWRMQSGRFLDNRDISLAGSSCVLGAQLARELFGNRSPLGQWVRIGERRFRVGGVLASQGESMGLNTDDLAIIPVASAQSLFNVPGLFRIIIEVRSREQMDKTRQAVLETLKRRHQGKEDVTLISQDAVVATFNKILHTLTLAVGGIAAISLAVAGILIMNVMLVATSQRTAEIGLLKALGALPRQIQTLFLAEAALLSLLGALLGVAVGMLAVRFILWLYPSVPFATPTWALAAALGIAVGTGLLFAIVPARKAARLDPVQALAR